MDKELLHCGHGSIHAAAMRDGKRICIPCFHATSNGIKQKEIEVKLDSHTLTICGRDKFGNRYGKLHALKGYDDDITILKYDDSDKAICSYDLMNVCRSKYVVRTWILLGPNESELVTERIPNTIMSYFNSMLLRWVKGKNKISWYNYIKNDFNTFIRNILKGLSYMHERKICHGNIGDGIAIISGRAKLFNIVNNYSICHGNIGDGIAIISGRAKLFNIVNNYSLGSFEFRRWQDFTQLQDLMQKILCLPDGEEGHRPLEVQEFAFGKPIFGKRVDREWEWKWLFSHSEIMHPKNKILFIEKLYDVFRRGKIESVDIEVNMSNRFKYWKSLVTQNCEDDIITRMLRNGPYSESYHLLPFLRNVFGHYNEKACKWTSPTAILEKLEKIFPRLLEELRDITKKIILDPTHKGETRDYLKQYFLNSNNQQSVAMSMRTTISDMMKTMVCDKKHCNVVPLSDCRHSCLKCFDKKGKKLKYKSAGGDMSIIKYKEMERAINSYNVLKLCEHEHIIGVWGLDNVSAGIFTDRISCTALSYFGWMSREWEANKHCSWFNYIQEDFKKIFRDVIKGLKYMYKRGFYHGNITNGIALTDAGKIKLFNVVSLSGTKLDSGRLLDFKMLQQLMITIINLQYNESERNNKGLKDVEAPAEILKFLALKPIFHKQEDQEWQWEWVLDTSLLMSPEQKILIIEKLWTVIFQWKLFSPEDIDANLVNLKNWEINARKCKDRRIKEMIETPKDGVISYANGGGFIRLLRNVVKHYNGEKSEIRNNNGEPQQHISREEIIFKLEETFEGLLEELRRIIHNIIEDKLIKHPDKSLKHPEMKRLKKYFLSSYKNEKTLPVG